MKKRIFVDTNILLDVLLEREGFYNDALKIWAMAESGDVEAYIAAISVNNVHYVIRRLKSETTAMIAVRIILRIFKVVPVDAEILSRASDFHDKDYEDDIQQQCALKANCVQIFTRNPTHYDSSLIAVLPPAAFMGTWRCAVSGSVTAQSAQENQSDETL